MEIHLKPELEAMAKAGVESGRFANVEEFVTEAIELLDLRLAYDEEHRLLEESIAQADRGELFTKEEVERDLDELRAQWLSSRQSAA